MSAKKAEYGTVGTTRQRMGDSDTGVADVQTGFALGRRHVECDAASLQYAWLGSLEPHVAGDLTRVPSAGPSLHRFVAQERARESSP